MDSWTSGRACCSCCIAFLFFVKSSNHINVSLNLQSCAHPREIMVEVLKALKELNVCWKNNGLYNMKCRWCFGAPEVHDMLDVNNNFLGDSTIMDNDDSNERLPSVIKFEMQVFNNFLYCLNFVCHEYILDI
jgi:hypothetical protein